MKPNPLALLRRYAVRREIKLVPKEVIWSNEWTFDLEFADGKTSSASDRLSQKRAYFSCSEGYPVIPAFTYRTQSRIEFANQMTRQMFNAILRGPLSGQRFFLEIDFEHKETLESMRTGGDDVVVGVTSRPIPMPYGLFFGSSIRAEMRNRPAKKLMLGWGAFVPSRKSRERELITIALLLTRAKRKRIETERTFNAGKERALAAADAAIVVTEETWAHLNAR